MECRVSNESWDDQQFTGKWCGVMGSAGGDSEVKKTWLHTKKCDPCNPRQIQQPNDQQCTNSLVGGANRIRLRHRRHRLKGAIELSKLVKLERKAHNLLAAVKRNSFLVHTTCSRLSPWMSAMVIILVEYLHT